MAYSCFMNLRTKMISIMTVFQGLLFLAIFFWIMQLTGGILKNTLVENLRLSAKSCAVRIESSMVRISQTATDLAGTTERLKAAGLTDRDFLSGLMLDIFTKNTDLFAVWAVFEPDAWDGKDAKFNGTEAYPDNGRFYPWVYRDEAGQPAVDVYISGDDEEATGEYYEIPFTTGKSLFLEPYAETVNDKTVLMTTYSVPLANEDGTRYGVAGIDIQLSFLSRLLEEANPGTGEYITIFSAEGVILGNTGDETTLGLNVGETKDSDGFDQVRTVSETGTPAVIESVSGILNVPVIRVLVPVQLPGATEPWVYAISIDRSIVFHEQVKALVTLVLSFGIGLAFLITGILILTKKIVQPLRTVSSAFTEMEKGNLTVRVPVTTRDEVGTLAKTFNLFSEHITTLFRSVTRMTASIGMSSAELEDSVSHTKEALQDIRSRIVRTADDMEKQTDAVDSAQKNVVTITARIDSLASTIEKQGAAVAEASSCVEQMVGNIQSLAQNTGTVVREFGVLAESGKQGKARLDTMNQKIADVSLKSSGLAETNRAVAQIAEHTSLLAINAAIEASHAGKAGLGFAVVANEIRALADNAQVRSKMVSDQLKGIEAVIAEVALASSDTKKSFDDIMHRIEQVNTLEHEAYQAVQEQRTGSEQVLAALTVMQDVSGEVKSAADSIREASTHVNGSMDRLDEVNANLAESVREITEKTDAIDAASEGIYALSVANGKQVESLAAEVGKYTFDFT